jgi:SAM-dependent methyltransferase
MKKLTDFFKDKEVNKVLDIGTGTGDFISVLKNLFTTCEIAGVDPDRESLQKAKQNYPGIKFYESTGENLIFTDNTFDVVSISMALHHLKNVKKALLEINRVLKPGGWLIVAELFSNNLNPAQNVHKMYHHFKSRIDRLNGISHNETFKKEEILNHFTDVELKILLDFEIRYDDKLITDPNELEERTKKMIEFLERTKNQAEYETLKPKIEEFREKFVLHGFQRATRLVVVAQWES